MLKNFSTAKIAEWSLNFTGNATLPFITKSGLIQLKELEDFVAAAKTQQADCVRIYFLRFQLNDTPTDQVRLANGQLAEGCKWFEASAGLSQASFAMVPAKNFRLDKDFIFAADDVVVNDSVRTLMPGIETKGTGLNPPPRTA